MPPCRGRTHSAQQRRKSLKSPPGRLDLRIALAFLFEYVGSYFDRSLKTPEDVDRLVKLPFLGLIPSMQSINHADSQKPLALFLKARHGITIKAGANGRNGNSNIELITLCNSKSLISEAYRHLRTSILLSSNGQNKYKSIVITSSKRGEGKTSTSINLAITLAQANKKVLLMDCDLRNPKIHRILGLKNLDGVSSFLSSGSMPLHHLIERHPSRICSSCRPGRFHESLGTCRIAADEKMPGYTVSAF